MYSPDPTVCIEQFSVVYEKIENLCNVGCDICELAFPSEWDQVKNVESRTTNNIPVCSMIHEGVEIRCVENGLDFSVIVSSFTASWYIKYSF